MVDLSILFLVTSTLLCFSMPVVSANVTPQVFHIESLSQIRDNQNANTLYLFDLDDTVLDSFSMLGSKAWRRYIVDSAKKHDNTENWHDIFTYDFALSYPVQAVENITCSFIKDLQNKKFVVCGLTARERNLWYQTPHNGVDILTVNQLAAVDVHFNNGSLEDKYPELAKDSEYFGGVFFSNLDSKGDFLLHLFETDFPRPEKIVFIDDKLSQVESVANALAKLGILHESYFYTATDKKGKVFDPLIANIQLYYFYESNGEKILSDEDAKMIAASHPEKDADYYLKAAIEVAKLQLSIKI